MPLERLSRSGTRFAREHVHAVHSVLAGCLLFGGRAKAVKTRGDANLLQAYLREILNELCLRQSAGDSTGPQIDVAAGVLGEFDIQRNVG